MVLSKAAKVLRSFFGPATQKAPLAATVFRDDPFHIRCLLFGVDCDFCGKEVDSYSGFQGDAYGQIDMCRHCEAKAVAEREPAAYKLCVCIWCGEKRLPFIQCEKGGLCLDCLTYKSRLPPPEEPNPIPELEEFPA